MLASRAMQLLKKLAREFGHRADRAAPLLALAGVLYLISFGGDMWAFRNPVPWLRSHRNHFPWNLSQEEKDAVAQQYFVGGAENVVRSAGGFEVDGWIGCFGPSYLMQKVRPDKVFARAGGSEVASTTSLSAFASDPAWGRPEFEAWQWQLTIPADRIPPRASDITFHVMTFWSGESQIKGEITLAAPKR